MPLPVFKDYADTTDDGIDFYPLDNLLALYNDFLFETGLPAQSAEDLIFDETINPAQRVWLSAFIALWEQSEEKGLIQ